MRYVSLFSGIEAASVAWEPLGWEPLAFAEVDPFACAVLKYRFPNVPNLGDVKEIDWEEFNATNGIVDVLVGGSPCQSFSIAGDRSGRAGESGLMAEYIRAVRDLVRASGGASPRYILWENVPGALSAERGVAFGQLLAELDELGYGLAWRVLDAQFARVPVREGGFIGPVAQRRRRVFLVGLLGNPGAAEILFERSCLRGDHPTGAAAREALTEDAASGSGVGGFKYHQGAGANGLGYEDGNSPTLMADYHQPAVVHCETQYGELAGTLRASAGAASFDTGQNVLCMASGQSNAAIDDSVCPTLDASNENPIFCATDDNAHVDIHSNHIGSLKVGGGHPWIAVKASNGEDVIGALCARDYKGVGNEYVSEGKVVCQRAYMMKVRGGSDTYAKWDGSTGTAGKGALVSKDVAFTVAATQDQTLVQPEHYVVRRLTPRECERLQGFPDDWTLVPYNGKPASDTPRYKAIGNSMAVPVMMLLGRRIEAFDILHGDEVGLSWSELCGM